MNKDITIEAKVRDKSEKETKKGTTRQHFDKLFGFAKEEPTQLAVASSSQSMAMDHVMSPSKDKMIPFSRWHAFGLGLLVFFSPAGWGEPIFGGKALIRISRTGEYR